MKILRLTSAITLLAVVLSTTSAKASDERDLATKIVGVWMVHPSEYGTLLKGGLRIFRVDKPLPTPALLDLAAAISMCKSRESGGSRGMFSGKK